MGGQDTPCLRVLFEVLCTLVNTFLLQEGVAIVVERRSSVLPNHNASLCLSMSLGTYSNKR